MLKCKFDWGFQQWRGDISWADGAAEVNDYSAATCQSVAVIKTCEDGSGLPPPPLPGDCEGARGGRSSSISPEVKREGQPAKNL